MCIISTAVGQYKGKWCRGRKAIDEELAMSQTQFLCSRFAKMPESVDGASGSDALSTGSGIRVKLLRIFYLLGDIVNAGVTHIFTFHQIDNVLRKVACMVTNPLQGTQ